MKTKLITLSILILFSVFFFSCEDKDTDSRSKNKLEGNTYVNNWIMDSMSVYYLWNNYLPQSKTLDFTLSSVDFFDHLLEYEKKLLNKGGYAFSKLDLTHANIPKATQNASDLGFEFVVINFVNQSGVTIGYKYIVIYVKEGTNAEKQGLKRGYIINEVDGVSVNKSNYQTLLFNNQSSYKLSYATNEINMYQGIYEEKTIQTTPNYTESPVFLDSIYTEGTRKIGYIVYNSFEGGSESSLSYDVRLAEIFTKFKQQNVKDLILDFRYNGGGLVRSARFIASALVPDRNTENIFEVKTYNPYIQSYLDGLPDRSKEKAGWMYEYFTDNVTNSNGKSLAPIPRLGDQLDNICFIVNSYTASASEMTINTLKPYIDDAGKNLYIVGKKTLGKNVGSWAIYEDNNTKNTCVIWPIVFQSHNKLYPAPESSAYGDGFIPDQQADDFELLASGLKNLGDKEETMLRVSIAKIMGYAVTDTKTRSDKSIISVGSSLDRKHSMTGGMYIDRDELDKMNINTLYSSKAK